MAGRPLRPATDRRLGRPLPHQLSNPTRSHLCPINLSSQSHATMRCMRYCQQFPVVIPLTEAGSPRVAHPSAARSSGTHPKNCSLDLARLACVRHAASVHPEPGSNSHKKFRPSVQKTPGFFKKLLLFSFPLILWFVSKINNVKNFRVVIIMYDAYVFHCSVINVLRAFCVLSHATA